MACGLRSPDTIFRGICCVLAALGFLTASTGSAAAADPFLLGPPTPPEGGPVVVHASFDLRDINSIDDEQETFEFEGVLVLEWQDPRLAFDPAAEGVAEKIFQGAYQFNEVFDGWFPQVVLINESGFYEQSGVVLRVSPGGALRLVATVDAGAKTDLDLVAHPFDRQRLDASFEVLGFSEAEVRLEVAATPDAQTLEPRVPQWHLERVHSSIRSRPASYTGGSASTFVVHMDVRRKSLFMVRLVVIPLLLIVILSWSVFWMEQSSLGDRISVSFIGILTVVSYQIILSESLPKISYMTLMNGFLNTSFFVMCACVPVNLWVGWCDRTGNSATGDRIDCTARWAFPLTYLILLGIVSTLTYLIA